MSSQTKPNAEIWHTKRQEELKQIMASDMTDEQKNAALNVIVADMFGRFKP